MHLNDRYTLQAWRSTGFDKNGLQYYINDTLIVPIHSHSFALAY